MFDIGWSELLLIGIVALVVIGPKELPTVLRTVGQWTAKLRRMASEFQSQFQEAMREAEMADLKKQVDEMTSEVRSYGNFDPVSEVRREFEKTQSEIENAVTDKPATEKAAAVPLATNALPAVASTAAATPATAVPDGSNVGAPETETAEMPSGGSGGVHDAEGKPA
jgi:sec-independent protein translocase protein TatB